MFYNFPHWPIQCSANPTNAIFLSTRNFSVLFGSFNFHFGRLHWNLYTKLRCNDVVNSSFDAQKSNKMGRQTKYLKFLKLNIINKITRIHWTWVSKSDLPIFKTKKKRPNSIQKSITIRHLFTSLTAIKWFKRTQNYSPNCTPFDFSFSGDFGPPSGSNSMPSSVFVL